MGCPLPLWLLLLLLEARRRPVTPLGRLLAAVMRWRPLPLLMLPRCLLPVCLLPVWLRLRGVLPVLLLLLRLLQLRGLACTGALAAPVVVNRPRRHQRAGPGGIMAATLTLRGPVSMLLLLILLGAMAILTRRPPVPAVPVPAVPVPGSVLPSWPAVGPLRVVTVVWWWVLLPVGPVIRPPVTSPVKRRRPMRPAVLSITMPPIVAAAGCWVVARASAEVSRVVPGVRVVPVRWVAILLLPVTAPHVKLPVVIMAHVAHISRPPAPHTYSSHSRWWRPQTAALILCTWSSARTYQRLIQARRPSSLPHDIDRYADKPCCTCTCWGPQGTPCWVKVRSRNKDSFFHLPV